MTDVDDNLMRQRRLYRDHLSRPALEILNDLRDQLKTGTGNGFIQLAPVEPALLFGQTLRFGFGRRTVRDHRAVLGDVFGKFFGANFPRFIDDGLFVRHAQRPQHHQLTHLIDDIQIGQRLAGYLGHAFPGYQCMHVQPLRHTVGGTQHKPLQHYAHLRVFYRCEDLFNHAFEGNRHKLDTVRAVVFHPQVKCHFFHCQLMGSASHVEETEVGQQSALDGHVTRDGRIKASGYKRQHRILTTERVTPEPCMGLLDYKQLLLTHLQRNSHFRVFEFHSGTAIFQVQAGADRLLDIYRFETLPTHTLAAHRKRLTRQAGPIVAISDLKNACHGGQRETIDLQKLINSRRAGERFQQQHFLHRINVARFYLKTVPVAIHHDVLINAAQNDF